MKFGVGQSVKRTEDLRLVTGQGRYTDDFHFDGETHAAFLRSPYAHARIKSIDISAAKAMPGVLAVLTQADVEAFGAIRSQSVAAHESATASRRFGAPKPLLAKDQVTFPGEAIAMVVAETYAQACDAAEAVAVDFEELPAAGTLEVAPSKPDIWGEVKGNQSFDWVTARKTSATRRSRRQRTRSPSTSCRTGS
jgi:carbon-monoxide dehydrogenase large subunit